MSLPQQFHSEELLTIAFERMLKGSLLPSPAGFLREFDCGAGIADFVLYRLNKDFEQRISIGAINPRYLFALSSLPYRQNFSEAGLARKLLTSVPRARAILKSFAAQGFCRPQARRGIWKKVRQPRALVTHLCGIEAKLANWRRALYQAHQYLEFANQAWVLLDQRNLRPALEQIEVFGAFNVGLAGIEADGSLHIHHMPAIVQPRSMMRFWQANGQIASSILEQRYGRAATASAQAGR
jgi:hypothetical protein